MKKSLNKVVVCILLISMIVSQFTINVNAAVTLYETSKDNVPVWSEATKKSTKLRTITWEGTTVKVTSSLINQYEHLWYKLDDGGYVFSENVRKHNHIAVMCGKGWTDYEQKDSTYHTKINYSGDELCSCGAFVREGTISRTEEYHDFDANNSCTDCGYYKEHEHVAVMCGKGWTDYEQKDSTYHTKINYSGDELCSCGAFVREGTISRTEEFHDFDANNSCTDCGYYKEYEHEHVATMCDTGRTIYQPTNAEYHTKVIYSGDNICTCGIVLSSGTTIFVQEEHDFKGDLCKFCDYKNEHVHTVTNTETDSICYTNFNAISHVEIVQSGQEICSCGEIITAAKTTYKEGAHTFDTNYMCIECGYTIGKETKDDILTYESYYTYGAITKENHTRMLYVKDSKTGIFDYKVVTEKHVFKDEICKYCGYSKNAKKDTTNGIAKSIAEQAVLGEFSDEVTVSGITAQVIIGEIPFIGTAADIRDLISSIVNYESIENVAINAVGLIPLIGSLKYSDEALTVVKNADEVALVAHKTDNVEEILEIVIKKSDDISDSLRVIKTASNTTDQYKSFDAFKRAYGKAGKGKEWHHIVEQSQIKKSGFTTEMINDAKNIIPLDTDTHRKVTGFYNRKFADTGMTYRDWIASQNFSFEQQQEIGKSVLKMFGVEVP